MRRVKSSGPSDTSPDPSVTTTCRCSRRHMAPVPGSLAVGTSASMRRVNPLPARRMPVPLTGTAALRAGQSAEPALWQPALLRTIEHKAADGFDLLTAKGTHLARGPAHRRRRRRDPHDAGRSMCWRRPRCSPRPRARILGIAVNNASRILRTLVVDGIAVVVTHRARRRLFGPQGLTLLGEVVRPPDRPDLNGGSSRPRHDDEAMCPMSHRRRCRR